MINALNQPGDSAYEAREELVTNANLEPLAPHIIELLDALYILTYKQPYSPHPKAGEASSQKAAVKTEKKPTGKAKATTSAPVKSNIEDI